jgi:CheY-like chemotaxis protein
MNPRILLVEDEVAISEPLAESLDREGFVTTVVATVTRARAFLERETPDLILLDVMLPDGDGRDLGREIRQSSDVPVIMLTARGEEIDRVLGLELGADDYVIKPFSFRELVAGSMPSCEPDVPRTLDRHVDDWEQVVGGRVIVVDPNGIVVADSQSDLTTGRDYRTLGRGPESGVRFGRRRLTLPQAAAAARRPGRIIGSWKKSRRSRSRRPRRCVAWWEVSGTRSASRCGSSSATASASRSASSASSCCCSGWSCWSRRVRVSS